jgi:hypothetical protein
VPGKVYEYLAIGRPILALTEEGETAELVRMSGLGVVVAPYDEEAIEAAVVGMSVAAARLGAVKPPRHLYDGNLAARKAVAVLDQLARARRRGSPLESPTPQAGNGSMAEPTITRKERAES